MIQIRNFQTTAVKPELVEGFCEIPERRDWSRCLYNEIPRLRSG